jgi:hypothetical protein
VEGTLHHASTTLTETICGDSRPEPQGRASELGVMVEIERASSPRCRCRVLLAKCSTMAGVITAGIVQERAGVHGVARDNRDCVPGEGHPGH